MSQSHVWCRPEAIDGSKIVSVRDSRVRPLFMDTVAEKLSFKVTKSRLPSTSMAPNGVSEVAPDVRQHRLKGRLTMAVCIAARIAVPSAMLRPTLASVITSPHSR